LKRRFKITIPFLFNNKLKLCFESNVGNSFSSKKDCIK
jgi:hypothetical protein